MSWLGLREELAEEFGDLDGYEQMVAAVETTFAWHGAKRNETRRKPPRPEPTSAEIEARRTQKLARDKRHRLKCGNARKHQQRQLARRLRAGALAPCPTCGGAVPLTSSGPIPTYCSRRCRKLAQARRRWGRLAAELNGRRRAAYRVRRAA